MSEFKVGDKVYLECKISEYDESDNTYYVDYSDYRKHTVSSCWIKDDVLHTADELYNKGLEDVWELARKIVLPMHKGGYTWDELENIFGENYMSLFANYTPQEAFAKVKEYEERNEIKVGDVVKAKGCVIEGIVTRVDSHIYRLFRDGSCNNYMGKEDLEKTGRHFDSIDEFMKN